MHKGKKKKIKSNFVLKWICNNLTKILKDIIISNINLGIIENLQYLNQNKGKFGHYHFEINCPSMVCRRIYKTDICTKSLSQIPMLVYRRKRRT